jgi:hypothetical protein
MKTRNPSPSLDRLVDPLGKCLTPESARRVLKLRADRSMQALLDQLAEKNAEGTLTPEQRAEYATYVAFGTFVALLKSKARQLLAERTGV